MVGLAECGGVWYRLFDETVFPVQGPDCTRQKTWSLNVLCVMSIP